jgi:speckle-type POZ protein
MDIVEAHEIEELINQIDYDDIQAAEIREDEELRVKYYKLEIKAKESEIRNLKAELKAKEKDCDNFPSMAEKLYYDKEFADVKIVCVNKTFDCHKAVLSCQSEVFKTMIKNKALTEKQEEVMKIHENDINSDSMEHLLFYVYHGKVRDTQMINTDLLRAADKYNVIGLFDMCVKYLESNLSLENALDVLVSAELINQKNLFDSASRFVRQNPGRLNKTGAYKEMFEKDPKFIAIVMSKMLDVE